MPAVYPSSVKPFDPKVDFTQVVVAEHINTLQDEVQSVESYIGTMPHVSAGYGSGAGSFTTGTTTWSTLAARVQNLEYGINADVHTQYLKFGGGDTIQSSNATVVGLTLQGFSSQTADLLRFKNSSGTVLTKVDAAGKLFVNNQEIKPILWQTTQPDAAALGLPTGTLWIDSDSAPAVLAAETTVQITGGTLTGDQALTSRLRNITVATTDPTGGNNGDIWIKYTA
jgi:hypothetical protein